MSDEFDHVNAQFTRLNKLFKAQPYLPIDKRIKILKLFRSMLLKQEQLLSHAVSKDFGYRCEFDTEIGDLLPTVKAITHLIKRLPTWCRDNKRAAGISLWPSKVKVTYQPLGVVGVIAPWNYPLQLALIPAMTAIAAGNRVMLKVSELTPQFNQTLTELVSDEFAEYLVIVQGDSEVAERFSSLAFAHLLFTGSTAVGKKVMQSAAANLTPVTLELGGKSPVIVLTDADLQHAAQTIVFGKMTNAGQICVAADYIFVADNKRDKLIQMICECYQKHYKQGVESKHLTSIISQAHYQRLIGYLDDAKQQGAQIVTPLNEPQCDELKHRLGLHILTDVSDSMTVMQEELFGPLLPIKSYSNIDQALEYINNRAKPLALYVLGKDTDAIKHVIKNTQSGTVAVNDILMQVMADNMPFGGVGDSGMGHYHGIEGFKTFSHARNTLLSPQFNPRIGLLLKQSKLLIKVLKKLYLRA